MTRRQWRKVCTMEALLSWDNLFLAAHKARKGKTRNPEVEAWWMRRESELSALRAELEDGRYQPGGYRFFRIYEPKQREIAAAPFRDRVVHHALCNLLQPVLEHRFIARSFSCQKGKGTTAARECCRKLTNRYRYVLKCDVRKFYPNLDHGILRWKLRRWIACPQVLGLVDQILGSYQTPEDGVVERNWFPGEDLAEVLERPRGLPIGNLTSQMWGNFYLDDLDHWITEAQGHGAYLRYTDDFLLFGDDKGRLWELREGIRQRLAEVRLRLAEPKSRLLATREGAPFCGFRFFPGLRPRVLGATKRRFEARRYAWHRRREDPERVREGSFAWYQFSREGNSRGLLRAYLGWPSDPRRKRRHRTTARVLRGASWNNNDQRNLLSSNRNNNDATNRNDNNGFRVVLSGVSSRFRNLRHGPLAVGRGGRRSTAGDPGRFFVAGYWSNR